MKIFITELLLIFLLCVGVTFPQGNPDYNPYGRKININPPRYSLNGLSAYWTTMATSPNALSRSASAYVELPGVGRYVYQFGGGSDNSLTSVVRYNLATNSWETTGFQPIPIQMSAATAITIGTTIYLFGGEKFTGLGKTCAFDATNGTWTTYSDMSTPVTDAAVVKYSDNYILIVGGGDGYFPGPGSTYSYSSNVQLFDVNNKSYSILPNSNYPLKAAMMGTGIINDTIFCVGGLVVNNGTGGVVDSVYKGIITKDGSGKPTKVTWFSLPKYPGGPLTRPASAFINKGNGAGLLVTGGAINGVSVSSFSYIWDAVNYNWTSLPDLPLARANMKAAFYPDSAAVFVVAGYTTIGTGETDKIVFSKFDGIAYPINPFGLVTPLSGASISTVAGSISPIAFNWDTSATGAGYKFRFKNLQGFNIIDTMIFQNLFKITSGDLDALLGRKGLIQGDSVTGSWNVTAFKGPGVQGAPDSLISTNGPWNLTLKRTNPVLVPFSLKLPISNTTIITSVLNLFPVNFSWSQSAVGARYKIMFASPSFDSLKFIKLNLYSNNSGFDTNFTVLNSALDSILAHLGMNRGDSLVGQWRVYSYNGHDSLASSNTNNLTLRRSSFNLTPFNLISPANNTTISLSNFAVLNFNWNIAAVGANYKWTFNSVSLTSNNNGFDTILTVNTTTLDALIGSGSSVTGTWKVWAYKGIDSLISAQSFNITFTRVSVKPLYQTFDSLQFPPNGWSVEYVSNDYWSRQSPNNNGAAKFDFFNATSGITQSLITNIFPGTASVSKLGSDSLLFDYAHAYVSASNVDSLILYYSIDNGVTYTALPSSSWGSNPIPFTGLSTTTYTAGPYSPGPNDFGTKVVALPAGTNRVKFLVKSGWGNNLYLDNIKIKYRPPGIVLPPNYRIDTVKSPVIKWDLAQVVSGFPNFYRLQLWTDSTFVDTTKLVKDIVIQDTNVYNYPDLLPANIWYTVRVNITNQGGTSRYSITPGHFFVDTMYVLNNSFTNPQFPQIGWRINSFGSPTFWSRDTLVGFGDNYSAKYDFYDASQSVVEEFITNTFTGNPYSSNTVDTLLFNYAHAFVGNFNVDSLFVYQSTNYGSTWISVDSAKFGSNPVPFLSLSTTTLTGSPFVPTQSQWGQKALLLAPGANKIKFYVASGKGNNLYLDNIRLRRGIPLSLSGPLPKVFKLNVNYPNPFNPTTMITYSIPKTSLTKLIIYDILGREIVKLVNEVKTPGNYQVQFIATNLSSGVYFYRLVAGDFVDTKKMLLIK